MSRPSRPTRRECRVHRRRRLRPCPPPPPPYRRARYEFSGPANRVRGHPWVNADSINRPGRMLRTLQLFINSGPTKASRRPPATGPVHPPQLSLRVTTYTALLLSPDRTLYGSPRHGPRSPSGPHNAWVLLNNIIVKYRRNPFRSGAHSFNIVTPRLIHSVLFIKTVLSIM